MVSVVNAPGADEKVIQMTTTTTTRTAQPRHPHTRWAKIVTTLQHYNKVLAGI